MYWIAILLVAGSYLPEAEQVDIFADEWGYQAEVRMPDETRCDLVTPTHAIEVEWAGKWKEAPAQAVLYSIWTKKKPGIVLLVKNRRQEKVDLLRCQLVCERLKIDLTIVDAVLSP